MAMVVVLLDRPNELTLTQAALSELARLGVTSVAVLEDGGATGQPDARAPAVGPGRARRREAGDRRVPREAASRAGQAVLPRRLSRRPGARGARAGHAAPG